MISSLLPLLREAGQLIRDCHQYCVNPKKDLSPVTDADLASHDCLVAGLSTLTPDIPIISEESSIPDYHIRKNWDRFWLIDPLDGTKEFIQGTGEYSICLALIEHKRPILGMIYGPEKEIFYYAQKNQGAFKQVGTDQAQPIFKKENKGGPFRVLCSRFHHPPETQTYLDHLGKPNIELFPLGSALKFGALAEGMADCYPRLCACSEWDAAAGDIILAESGYSLRDYETNKPLDYNTRSLRCPWFIAD